MKTLIIWIIIVFAFIQCNNNQKKSIRYLSDYDRIELIDSSMILKFIVDSIFNVNQPINQTNLKQKKCNDIFSLFSDSLCNLNKGNTDCFFINNDEKDRVSCIYKYVSGKPLFKMKLEYDSKRFTVLSHFGAKILLDKREHLITAYRNNSSDYFEMQNIGAIFFLDNDLNTQFSLKITNPCRKNDSIVFEKYPLKHQIDSMGNIYAEKITFSGKLVESIKELQYQDILNFKKKYDEEKFIIHDKVFLKSLGTIFINSSIWAEPEGEITFRKKWN